MSQFQLAYLNALRAELDIGGGNRASLISDRVDRCQVLSRAYTRLQQSVSRFETVIINQKVQQEQ